MKVRSEHSPRKVGSARHGASQMSCTRSALLGTHAAARLAGSHPEPRVLVAHVN
jgi:hypothetical protein